MAGSDPGSGQRGRGGRRALFFRQPWATIFVGAGASRLWR